MLISANSVTHFTARLWHLDNVKWNSINNSCIQASDIKFWESTALGKLFKILTQISFLSFLCLLDKTLLWINVLLFKNHRVMCVLSEYWTLRFSVLLIFSLSLKECTVCIYFLYSFFLGMPDKDSMSSSALCQVSKNCSKVNHTQFCPFFAGGGGIWLWKM